MSKILTSSVAAAAVLVLSSTGNTQDATPQEGSIQPASPLATIGVTQEDPVAQGYADHDTHHTAINFSVEELQDLKDWAVSIDGVRLGDVDRLGIDGETGELLAIVPLDSVLGLNMKEIAIPLTNLRQSGDRSLSASLSDADLQRAREFTPWFASYSQLVGERIKP